MVERQGDQAVSSPPISYASNSFNYNGALDPTKVKDNQGVQKRAREKRMEEAKKLKTHDRKLSVGVGIFFGLIVAVAAAISFRSSIVIYTLLFLVGFAIAYSSSELSDKARNSRGVTKTNAKVGHPSLALIGFALALVGAMMWLGAIIIIALAITPDGLALSTKNLIYVISLFVCGAVLNYIYRWAIGK